MQNSKPKLRHFFALSSFRIVFASVCLFTLVFALHVSLERFAHFRLFSVFERLYVDHKLRFRDERKTPSAVALVGIGEASLRRLGRFPFPRGVYADLITRLDQAGAKVVAFDILFAEPQVSSTQLELAKLAQDFPASLRTGPVGRAYLAEIERRSRLADDDERLAAAIGNTKIGIILGFRFNIFSIFGREDDFEQSQAFALLSPEERRQEIEKRNLFKPKFIPFTYEPGFSLDYAKESVFISLEPILPMTKLFAKADPKENRVRYGFFNASTDFDGILRQLALVTYYQGNFYPSLSFAAATMFLNPKASPQGHVGKEGILGLRVFEAGGRHRNVPVDSYGRLWINYYGNKMNPEVIRRYELIDVLDGKVARAELEGKLVFVGTLEETLGDNKAVPLSASFPGVEANATIAANILDGAYLFEGMRYFWAGILLLLVGGSLFGWVVAKLGAIWAAVFGALVLGTLFSVDQRYIFPQGLILPTLWAGAEYLVIFFGVMVHKFAVSERDKRFIHSAFSRFVSKSVAEEILKDPARLKLGGEKRELTVLFSDIRNFTEMAEKLDAALVSEFLNAFFTRMTAVVLENRGTLDKYIGDSIMCFWGAPLAEPRHAELACRTALAMAREVTMFNREWKGKLGFEIAIRIGLNTGEMAVGNMGSEQIFEYTVLGDNVNLASRLEGVNKDYGTTILAGYNTFAQCSDRFLFRPVDRIQVRGRDEPVEICELIAANEEVGLELEWVETFARARAAYNLGQWEEARAIFATCRELHSGDHASQVFLDRIASFQGVQVENQGGIWRARRG